MLGRGTEASVLRIVPPSLSTDKGKNGSHLESKLAT